MKIILNSKKLIVLIVVFSSSLLFLKWFWLDKPPPADSTKERIAFVIETAFPDLSAFLVYRRLHLTNLDGSGETNLGEFWDWSPAWSKEGDRFVYSGEDGLYVVKGDDIDSAELLLLGITSYPTWSPDGGKVAFVYSYSHTLNILDIASGQVTQILDDSIPGYDLEWSPTGQQIMFNWFRFNEEKRYVADIAIINIDGSGFHQVTTDGKSLFPKWSPDGQKIAFDRGGNIYVMDADGSNTKALTSDGKSLFPVWSPDGQYILYESDVNEECGPPDDDVPGFCTDELHIMEADGSNVRLFWKGKNQRVLYFTWLPGLH